MGELYRNISAERRQQAAACVDRHVHEMRALLSAKGLPCRIVDGSAAAAEVYLSDTNTLHTAVRVAMHIDAGEQPDLARALAAVGFAACEPAGDMTLLRLAATRGRRAIHVLIEGDGRIKDGDQHPADPAAVRARTARLASAMLPLAASFRRVRDITGEEHDVTESFEVHLIEAPGAR
jgi:hypothetical protein